MIKNSLVGDKLTVEKCRERLGYMTKDMTDDRVEEIRDYLYAFVQNIIDQELIHHYRDRVIGQNKK